MWRAQFSMLRMNMAWSLPGAFPWGSKGLKDVFLLSHDTFCVVWKNGSGDVFCTHDSQEQPLRWLTDLRVFENERVRLVSHLSSVKVILVIFLQHRDPHPGTLYVRGLDVEPLLDGTLRVHDCGLLSNVAVRQGGFVEVSSLNQRVFVYDKNLLSCVDSNTFETSFTLGPWSDELMVSFRFTQGLVAVVRAVESGGAIDFQLYSVDKGAKVAQKQVELLPVHRPIVFLEFTNGHAILKREGSDVLVVDLFGRSSQCILTGLTAWEPSVFVFSPTWRLMLALCDSVLEVWRVPRPESCCRIGVVSPLADLNATRLSVDDRLAMALVLCQTPQGKEDGEDLALLDLLQGGTLRGVLPDVLAWTDHGGGVSHMDAALERGAVLLVGSNGDVCSYSTSGAMRKQ